MAQIALLEKKCNGCCACITACPFGAIELMEGRPALNAACKTCGLCIKACPQGALIRLETKAPTVDKSQWRDILVLAEASAGRLHPVSLELIGKALELAKPVGYHVKALLIGCNLKNIAEELTHYEVEEIILYEDSSLSFFRADAYAACGEDCIGYIKPSVVLVGATTVGRSLAPRLATRFKTGLTADCTQLELRENTDLIQIRPAFGGNIMAQIVTPHTRPQFATVRYKVMDAPLRKERAQGQITFRKIPPGVEASTVRHLKTVPLPPAVSISDAEILVAAGRGLQKEEDLQLVKELAAFLGGDWAVTRPLVEKGWAPAQRQIGLSGRTVRPRLLIACGISGAIQFTACMDQSERIIAINSDPHAPIFQVAHAALVGDLYQILPPLLEKLRQGKQTKAAQPNSQCCPMEVTNL